MTTTPRQQLAEDLLRRLASALRSAQLYAPGHPIVARSLAALATAIQHLHELEPSIVIGIVGEEIVVDETPIAGAEAFESLVQRLRQNAVERITIDRGVAASEIQELVDAVMIGPRAGDQRTAPVPVFPHIRVGRLSVEQRVGESSADMAALRRLYGDAVSVATNVWESTQAEGKPDATITRTMIDGLAQAVAHNRTGLLALTTLKNYDNYTFTHMVNVSILTMGQARALGIDGPLLREFGMAALLHDIGKVRTPPEVLNKATTLTEAEFQIMKRHALDGAEILRGTPDMPVLAPVVALEHHLRVDGTGYPTGVSRPSLNLGTMLCSIADVYDAMRSQRGYQQAFPSERVLEVLKRNDGRQFDQHLVRRFVQLIGVYPAGNLVRLDSGEVAVVVKVHAPDPRRPQVRVLLDRQGTPVELPCEINLWETEGSADRASAIVAPLDPADYEIDPLALM